MFKSIVRSTMDIEKENTIKVLTEMNKRYLENQVNIYETIDELNSIITNLTIQLNVCVTYDSFIDSIKNIRKDAKKFQYTNIVHYLNRLILDVNLIKELYE